MRTTAKPSVKKWIKVFGGTPKQAKAMFALNSEGLNKMADIAKESGKKIQGYTEEQLRHQAAQYLEASK